MCTLHCSIKKPEIKRIEGNKNSHVCLFCFYNEDGDYIYKAINRKKLETVDCYTKGFETFLELEFNNGNSSLYKSTDETLRTVVFESLINFMG